MKSVYIQKCEKLRELRTKYLLNPDEETKQEIYKLDKEIKEIDKSIGFRSTPGGNYKPSYKFWK